MFIVEALLNAFLGFLDLLLPVFNFDDAFLNSVDVFFSKFIDLLMTAGYFIDFDTFIKCILVILAVDNYVLLIYIGKWIINLVRGSGT